MHPDPELTIIVVNWNTREMTLACLRSLYAETRAPTFEVILVDNGSADGSAQAIAAEFPQVHLLAEAENHGFARANNLAAVHARGRRLLLLNSDTLFRAAAIDRLWAFAEAHPAAGIWGGRTFFADGSLNIGSAWGAQTVWSTLCFALGLTALFRRTNLFNPEALGNWQRDSEREVDIVSGCFLLIDTALWQRLGGFDPAFFMYGEEADLCARARDLGACPRVTPTAEIVHYGGASAATRSDPMVRLFHSKIRLAHRRTTRLAAETIRWLYLVAVAFRAAAYSAARRPQAQIWRETLARRAEWFS